MIVKLLMNLIYLVFSALTLPISIPSVPVKVLEVLATALDYFTSGIAILGNFFDMEYLFVLWGIVMLVDAGVFVYHLVMWVLKKIPILGIK